MGTEISLDDFEMDAYWVPIDEPLPPFGIWLNHMITHEKRKQSENDIHFRTAAFFQSKIPEMEAAFEYAKGSEIDYCVRHFFSNQKRSPSIDPLFFPPGENYIFMRDECSAEVFDENKVFWSTENFILGSFHPVLAPGMLINEPSVLECGFRKSFKKVCHKAGKIWKKHKTEILIGAAIVVLVVVAAVVFGGPDAATLAAAGGALLDQLNPDHPDGPEQNTPEIQNLSQRQIGHQSGNSQWQNSAVSPSPLSTVRPLDSPDVFSSSFSKDWNTIHRPEDTSFPVVSGQFEIDRRPSKTPSSVPQKPKDANPFSSAPPIGDGASQRALLADVPSSLMNPKKPELPSSLAAPKYPQGVNFDVLRSFSIPLSNATGTQGKNASPSGPVINTNSESTPKLDAEPLSRSEMQEVHLSRIQEEAELEARWGYLWNGQTKKDVLSAEEQAALKKKFPSPFSVPLDPNSTISQREEAYEQHRLAFEKAVAAALVDADPSATDLSYDNFAAKAFKGEAFNGFASPPPFGALPLIGLPFQRTVHVLGGIANSDVTMGESGYCLHKTLEKEFAIQPHRLHSDNLPHGLTMVALEKLSEIELQRGITNWIPFLQDIDGAKFLARALAKTILENSRIQESIDYTVENFSRLADEIIKKDNPKLKQVHIPFSNAGHVCNEALKRLTLEQRQTIIIIPVGTTAIIEDSLACKVFNVIGNKDWPSITCNGGLDGIREKSEKATVTIISQEQTQIGVGGHYFMQPDYQNTIKEVIYEEIKGEYEVY